MKFEIRKVKSEISFFLISNFIFLICFSFYKLKKPAPAHFIHYVEDAFISIK